MPPAKRPAKPAAQPAAATPPKKRASAPKKRASAKPATPTEAEIAVRAYHISETEPSGDPVAHWLRAERELSTPAPKPRARKPAATRS